MAGLALTVVPLALPSVIARRMGRGWLVTALPWILVLLAAGIYSGAATNLLAANDFGGMLRLITHLLNAVTPPVLMLSLAVLAVLGVKKAPNPSEHF